MFCSLWAAPRYQPLLVAEGKYQFLRVWDFVGKICIQEYPDLYISKQKDYFIVIVVVILYSFSVFFLNLSSVIALSSFNHHRPHL